MFCKCYLLTLPCMKHKEILKLTSTLDGDHEIFLSEISIGRMVEETILQWRAEGWVLLRTTGKCCPMQACYLLRIKTGGPKMFLRISVLIISWANGKNEFCSMNPTFTWHEFHWTFYSNVQLSLNQNLDQILSYEKRNQFVWIQWTYSILAYT